MMIEAFAAWLGKTPLSAFVAGQDWVVPTVQTLHILAISVVVGGVLILHLRVLGVLEKAQPIGVLARRFAGPAACAIGVLAVTGVLMIAGEPNRALFRYVFWIKMLLLAMAIGLSAAMLRGLKATPAWIDAAVLPPLLYRALAGGLLLVWVAIIVAGRWIGYAEGWPGSPL
jgi:putative copper export protein